MQAEAYATTNFFAHPTILFSMQQCTVRGKAFIAPNAPTPAPPPAMRGRGASSQCFGQCSENMT